MKKGISKKEQLSFALGAIGKDVAFAFIFLSITSSMKHSLIIGGAFLSLVPVIAKFLDALTDPLIGFIIDKTHTRYGKLKPYIFIGTLLFSIFSLGYIIYTQSITNNLDIDNSLNTSIYLFSALIFAMVCLSYSIMDVAFWAMIPTFGSTNKVRDEMAIMGRLGAILGYSLVISLFYCIEQKTISPVLENLIPYGIILFFIISQAVVLINVTDRSVGYSNSYLQKTEKIVQTFFSNDQLFVIALQMLLIQFVFFVTSYTVHDFFESDSLLYSAYYFPVNATGFAGQIIGYLYYLKLRTAHERRTIFIAVSVITTLSLIGLLAGIHTKCIGIIFTAYFILNLSIGLGIVCMTVMQANTVDYGEFKSNCRLEGLTFSMQTTATKLAIGFALVLMYVTPNINIFGVNYIFESYCINLIIIIACSLLLLYVYLRHFKLSGSFYLHMLNTLDRLRGIENKEDLNYISVRYALDEDAILMHENITSDNDSVNILNIVKKLTKCLIAADLIDNPYKFEKELDLKLKNQDCGIAEGIAIAHIKSKYVRRSALALARLNTAIDCGAIDDKKCDLIFLIASPPDPNEHLNLLGKLSLLLNEPKFSNSIRNAGSQSEILEQIIKYEKCFIQE